MKNADGQTYLHYGFILCTSRKERINKLYVYLLFYWVGNLRFVTLRQEGRQYLKCGLTSS